MLSNKKNSCYSITRKFGAVNFSFWQRVLTHLTNLVEFEKIVKNDLLVFILAILMMSMLKSFSLCDIIFKTNILIKCGEVKNKCFKTKGNDFGCSYSFAFEVPKLRVASGILLAIFLFRQQNFCYDRIAHNHF